MKKLWAILVALIGTLNPLNGEAKLVQILHTNDLHSYLESTIKDPKKGGYATPKSLIEKEKRKALKKEYRPLFWMLEIFLKGTSFFFLMVGSR